MKKKMTITGIFNDYFTNYEDKESSVSFEIDDELNCSCYKENGRCLIHFPPEGYVISDIDKKEKLVHEYLNSMVGDNPTLSVSKRSTHLMRGLKMFSYDYIVNGVKVGSRPHGVSKVSMKSELYNSTRKLFGLNHVDTSRYFNRWLSDIPVDE